MGDMDKRDGGWIELCAQDLHEWQYEEVKDDARGMGMKGMPRRSRKWRSPFGLKEEEGDDRHEVMFAGQSPRDR